MPFLQTEIHRSTIVARHRRALACHLAGERMMCSFDRLRALVEKDGFREGQPRIPAGNGRESGRWTYQEGYAQGRQPGIGDNGGPALEPATPPKEPLKEKVSKIKAAKALAKTLARQALRRAGPVGIAILAGHELYTEWPSIRSYQDAPKSLEELQTQAGKKRPGYDDHHIVEQSAGVREGFSRSDIDGASNVVSIPRYKHHEITGWYTRVNPEFGMQTPRQYLQGRDWSEHMRMCYRALRDNGVLK